MNQLWQLFISLTSRIAAFKVEKVFLCLAIIFGVAFTFLTAPFQAPDEFIHFFRSYDVASGHWTGKKIWLPLSVFEFSEKVSPGIAGNDQNKQSKRNLVNEFNRQYRPQPLRQVDITNIAVYSPVPYLPQAFGISLGRLGRFPPIVLFYLARLVNLAVWIGLSYFAIRITPVHPRLFAALALMPMTLFIAASCSPDAFTIGISFLWIASVLRKLRVENPRMKAADWAWLALLAALLALSKTVYVLLVFLVLLLPIRNRQLWRPYLVGSVAVFLAALLVGVLWLQLSVGYLTASTSRQYNMSTVADLGYILKKPGVTLRIFSTSIQYSFAPQTRMMVGVLGWVDTPLVRWIYPAYYLLLFFLAIFEPHPRYYFTWVERLWILGMGLASYLLMMVILFNPAVDVGNGRITLAQGRYYIPFAPLFFLPFSQKKYAIPADSPAWAAVIGFHALVLGITARILLQRYYAI